MPNRKDRRKALKGKHEPQYTKKRTMDKYPNGCFGYSTKDETQRHAEWIKRHTVKRMLKNI